MPVLAHFTCLGGEVGCWQGFDMMRGDLPSSRRNSWKGKEGRIVSMMHIC